MAFDPWGRGNLRAPRERRFDEYYRAYPMIMAPGAERPELNYGSKIFLPASALEKISRLHVQWPIMLEIHNGAAGKHSHAGVLEFVAEEGKAYIPQWMMQTLGLDVGDMIQIKTTSLELAKLVKLQPQDVKFLEITDPKAVLEKAFRNFATLTKGDIFSFEYNNQVFDIAVLEVKPETEKMGVCMIETDVSVDFAAPLGYVEPERQSGTSTPRSMAGGGLPAGGLLHNQGTMAQSINYDALAPSALAAQSGNFGGGGHKLGTKKGSKAPTPKPATPVAGTSVNTKDILLPKRRNADSPMPLRLPPHKLFLGYEIKPVKTKEDKERELANARQPHFAGQGQSLRKKGEVGEKMDEDEKKPTPEPKARRLDGRPV
ncbi:ubiquitin fusion degradation protein 1 [Podospora australis]|uniref:Ubiquitin fusion degradation protein 1 n=1 Tax=Podospora australis TaxID=1536484 RepID=A0AAN7AIU5_9PEZI|nr:ubiquitin fusion degradation protein 1 [Podospora australis]